MKHIISLILILALSAVLVIFAFSNQGVNAGQLSRHELHLITGTECDGCLTDEPCGPLCEGNDTTCMGCDPSGQIEVVVPRSRPTCCTGQGTGTCISNGTVKCEVAYPCEQHFEAPAICDGEGSTSWCKSDPNSAACYWYSLGDCEDPNGLDLDTYVCNTGM